MFLSLPLKWWCRNSSQSWERVATWTRFPGGSTSTRRSGDGARRVMTSILHPSWPPMSCWCFSLSDHPNPQLEIRGHGSYWWWSTLISKGGEWTWRIDGKSIRRKLLGKRSVCHSRSHKNFFFITNYLSLTRFIDRNWGTDWYKNLLNKGETWSINDMLHSAKKDFQIHLLLCRK